MNFQAIQIGPGVPAEKLACVAIYNAAMRAELGDSHWELDERGWDESFEGAKWSDWQVARDGSEPVGFILSCGYGRGRDLIQMLAVDARRKGTGIGTALMEQAKRGAAAHGCSKLRAYVRDRAQGAQAFYRKAKGRIGYDRPDLDAYGEKVFPVDIALGAPKAAPKP